MARGAAKGRVPVTLGPRAALLACLLPLLGAAPPPPEVAEMIAERDALIDKIVRGVDYDESVRRFVALHQKKARMVMDAETTANELQRARDAQRAWREAYRKSADHEVGWRCTLSPDPRDPIPSNEGRLRPDWGRVTRRAEVRLPPKNELDEGERWTLLEVEGRARRHVLRADHFGLPDRTPLAAQVGDLVLLCEGSAEVERRLPPEWQTAPLSRSGFAVRIQAPPLIEKKAALRPVHVSTTRFFWAIKEVRWRYEGQRVLANIEIGKDLGDGRYEIEALQGLSWILEVPKGLRNAQALVPGRSAWVIVGPHRFDPALRKLVLQAEDIEERYVLER